MTAPRELRTARLVLRSIKRADIPALVRLAGAREIAATTLGFPHPYTEKDARAYLAKANKNFRAGSSVIFAISIFPTREMSGDVGLFINETHNHAELGYWIGVPFWGKGYATEAAFAAIRFGFKSLHLHRIYARLFCGNTASKSVLEKIGMRYEGRSRQHIKKWGRFVDIENYGMLAKEIRSRQ